jgi:hypothetical protein
MFNLPEKTILGCLHIETVFQFYDVPRLFTCSNNSGNKFLVLSVFDDYEIFKWIYLPLSIDRLSSLIGGMITLKQAFLDPEDHYLFLVESDFEGKSKITHVSAEQLDEDDLPADHVYLEMNQEKNIECGVIDAELSARGSKRETLNLHFRPWGIQLPEIEVKHLGSILTSFQKLVNTLGQHLNPKSNRNDTCEETKFRVTQTFAGSFGIQLRSKSTSDLLNSSLASNVLLELINLLETRDNESDISDKLHELEGKVASKYGIFLEEVSKLDSPMELHWGSPIQERGRNLSLTKQEIKNAFQIVSKIDVDARDFVTFNAELLGLDVKTKQYRVKRIDDSGIYTGKILDESLNIVQHSEINGIYEVTLKKVIETNSSSGSESTKWQLTDLTPQV